MRLDQMTESENPWITTAQQITAQGRVAEGEEQRDEETRSAARLICACKQQLNFCLQNLLF